MPSGPSDCESGIADDGGIGVGADADAAGADADPTPTGKAR